jgi:hypothetical protein
VREGDGTRPQKRALSERHLRCNLVAFVQPARHPTVVACALLIAALSSRAAWADSSAAGSSASPPAAPSPDPGASGDAEPPARTVKLAVPLEVEVHGRLFFGVLADARDDWARQLGLRSARIGIEARLPGVLTVLEADLVSSSPIEDAFVRLDGPFATRLQAGRFKAPFSARRLESSWRLPLVDRGLVDDYLVRRNGLGGRRLGATGAVRPWEGRVALEVGAFVADKGAVDGERAEDLAGRVVVRPWKALEVGATAYRAGTEAEGVAEIDVPPRREAATAYVTVNLGPLEATVEGLAGRIAQGPFAAATAIAGWTFRVGEGGRLRVTPVAGGEAIELRGEIPGKGHAVIAGAVLARAEGLKVKIVGERALRPGDEVPENAVALEVATRF